MRKCKQCGESMNPAEAMFGAGLREVLPGESSEGDRRLRSAILYHLQV